MVIAQTNLHLWALISFLTTKSERISYPIINDNSDFHLISWTPCNNTGCNIVKPQLFGYKCMLYRIFLLTLAFCWNKNAKFWLGKTLLRWQDIFYLLCLNPLWTRGFRLFHPICNVFHSDIESNVRNIRVFMQYWQVYKSTELNCIGNIYLLFCIFFSNLFIRNKCMPT